MIIYFARRWTWHERKRMFVNNFVFLVISISIIFKHIPLWQNSALMSSSFAFLFEAFVFIENFCFFIEAVHVISPTCHSRL